MKRGRAYIPRTMGKRVTCRWIICRKGSEVAKRGPRVIRFIFGARRIVRAGLPLQRDQMGSDNKRQ